MASINVLTVNAGSSSLKATVFPMDGRPPQRLLEITISTIGEQTSIIRWHSSDGAEGSREQHVADHAAAAQAMLQVLEQYQLLMSITSVGHRLVHGGQAYWRPTILTSDITAALEPLASLDPEHTPAALRIITVLQTQLPRATQVACFDTGFFHDMPHVAQLLSTPRKYAKLGLQRYGFHGLSYAYVFQRFAEIAGADAAQGRIIMAHLGSGASLAAVHHGKPVDTTMGFSPASGIMMSSRSGDLDPGVAGYLHRQAGMNFDEYDRMVHFESGLKGVSGTSADMLTLLKREPDDDAAHDAIELFCYDVKKAIGSLAATLGGLDSLIFTGGIGEPAAGIRSRICSGLEFLGVNLNSERNAANAERISADGARAGVHVIPTDEALTIYQQTLQATLRGDNHDEQR